jgi:RNA 2',3'-cyclic 3'-phosphodiesterase
MRVFIALQLPIPVIDELIRLQDTFKRNRRRGNLTTPQNMHLTLAFIGEADYAVLDRVEGVLESLDFSPLTLTLDHLGSFNRKDGTVWWVGLKNNPSLSDLHKTLIDGLREAEVPFDPKPFRPHITIVRNYAPAIEPVTLPTVEPLTFTVNALTLMRSHRVNEVLVYSPLALFMASEESQ